jgi:hypothetical protein
MLKLNLTAYFNPNQNILILLQKSIGLANNTPIELSYKKWGVEV